MVRSASSDSLSKFETLLAEARAGSNEALGGLLEGCRQYLMLVANRRLDPVLRAKVGPSDVVQETLHDAQRDFARFHGDTWRELVTWLRRILLNNVTDVARRYHGADKRRVGREIPIGEVALDELYADEGRSPCSGAMARERDEALWQAMEQLPELGGNVIRWRNYERCSFEVIGQRIGRSAEAARKIWVRSLLQLQRLLESLNESV